MKRKAVDCPKGQHGPIYNVAGAGLASHRKVAKDSLAGLDREARHAYGQGIEDAVRALQRREFIRESTETELRCPCASGTWHSDGEAISQAVRDQQHRALMSWPAKCRAARTPHEWESLYEAAMEATAAAIADRLLAGNSMWEQAA